MNTLVLYDSNYGNTQKIAEAIAETLHTKAYAIDEIQQNALHNIDLLIVGSPINGWRPTEKMQKFLQTLNNHDLTGITSATFDTRVQLFIHGDAAGKIAHALEDAGAKNIATHGFFVKGTQGPLLDGEREKAKDWAEEVKNHYLHNH